MTSIWIEIFRAVFFIGFVFLLVVAGWAIVQIQHMKRDQAIAIATLKALAARSGLKDVIEELSSTLEKPSAEEP